MRCSEDDRSFKKNGQSKEVTIKKNSPLLFPQKHMKVKRSKRALLHIRQDPWRASTLYARRSIDDTFPSILIDANFVGCGSSPNTKIPYRAVYICFSMLIDPSYHFNRINEVTPVHDKEFILCRHFLHIKHRVKTLLIKSEDP